MMLKRVEAAIHPHYWRRPAGGVEKWTERESRNRKRERMFLFVFILIHVILHFTFSFLDFNF